MRIGFHLQTLTAKQRQLLWEMSEKEHLFISVERGLHGMYSTGYCLILDPKMYYTKDIIILDSNVIKVLRQRRLLVMVLAADYDLDQYDYSKILKLSHEARELIPSLRMWAELDPEGFFEGRKPLV